MYKVVAESNAFLNGYAGECPVTIDVAIFDSLVDANQYASSMNTECDGLYYSVHC